MVAVLSIKYLVTMVKINFESLRVFKDIDHKIVEIKDVKKRVADELYSRGQGIEFHALALKIYNSKGETEFDDEEYRLIMIYANQRCTPAEIDAFTNCKQKEDTDNG
jgi:hypothetical protein